MTKLTRVEICSADHDHSLGAEAVPPCKYGVKEAIIELTDAEVAEIEAARLEREAEAAAQALAAAALAELKASAKAKLVAGQPLTPEEADTLIL